MKTFKRALSCFLAMLMIFGSFSVLSYAALEDNDNISSQIYTKYFVDGVETDTIKAGDTVKARVYLATNYMLGCSTIFWVYPSDILEFDATSLTGAKDVGYGMMQYDAANAFNTVDGPAAAAKFTGYVVQQVGVTIDSYSAADDMVYEGFFTEEYFDDKGWVWLNIDGGAGSPQIFEPDANNVADDWIAEFTFTVKDTVVDGDEGYFNVPAESLINTTDHYYGKTGIQRAKTSSGFASVEAFDIEYNMDVSMDTNVVTVGTAVVVPETYPVTYTYAGDIPAGYTAPASIELEEGAAIEEPEVTIPAGYKLTWTMTGDVDGAMGTEAVTMTGTWAKIDYAVDYVYAGDVPAGITAPAATTANIGDAIVVPNVTVAGYNVVWTMTGDVNGAMGTEAVTVTGTWTKKSTTITFSHTGSAPAGVTSDSVTATYGEDAADYIAEYIDNNLKGQFPGYSVSGWTVVEGSTDNDGVYLVGEDPIAVEINWTKIPYTVSFAFEGTAPTGVDVPASFKTTVGEVIAAPAVEVPAGYELAWDVTGATANDDGTYTAGANKVSFVGTWSKIGYAVSYEFAGNVPAGITAPADASTTVGDTIAAPAVEVPAGYELAWTVTGATANADGSYTAGANDVAFVGTWSKIEYAVNYEYAGDVPADFTAPAAAKATIGDPIVVPTVEAPEGYTLTWTMSGDVDGAMGTEAVTVTGTWAKNSYTITYYLSYEDQAEGNVYDTQTVKFGEKVELIDAEVPGNIFDGWDLEVDTMPAENLEAVAVLTPKVVYFYSIYEEVILTMEEVDEITEADLPSAEDATEGEDVNFIEWQINDETLETPYAVDSAEVEVYPYCTVDIVFYTDEDCETVYETLTFEYGYEITEEDLADLGTPDKKKGHYLDPDMPWADDFLYAIAEANTYTYAYWLPDTYEVIFEVDGEEYERVEATFGEAIELPETAPAKEGYTFKGWTDVEGGSAIDEIILTEEGMTLYPVYIENGKVAYTVEIYLMDETGAYTTPVKVGGTAAFGTTVTVAHADYAQEAWFSADTSEDAHNVYTGVVAEDGSTTLELYFKRAQYEVAIFGENVFDLYHGATITAPETSLITPDGYVLKDWNNGEYAKGEVITITGPLTLTPNFVAGISEYTINTYIMGLDGEYGAAVSSETKTATTDTFAYYTAPVMEGFTADKDRYSTLVDGDGKSVIEVHYIRNQYDVVINGETTKVYYGETITAPTEAKDVPAGYELESWNDGAYKPGQEIEVKGPITFTPDFKAVEVKYTVEIYLENTDGDYVLADSIEETGVTATTATAAHADYAQAEYYVADTDNEKNVFSAEIKGDGSTVLALYYDLVKYDVTIGDETTKVPHGATITAPTEAKDVPAGYELESWNDGAYALGQEIEVTGPITFTPDFKAVEVKYTVEIYLENTDGDYVLADSIEKAGVTATTATAAHADYAQAEYYIADTDNEKNVFSAEIKGDGSTVLALYYDLVKYDVTINGETTQVPHGTTITAPTEAKDVPAGYELESWNDGAYALGQEIVVTGPITFTPDFVAVGVKYTVEIYLADAEGNYALADSITETGVTGETATAAHADYAQAEYYLADMDADNKFSDVIAGNGSTVLALYFKRATYTVTYEDENGDVLDTAEVVYGAAISAPDYTTPDGMTFLGWFDKETSEKMPATMPAKNATYVVKLAAGDATPYTIQINIMDVDGKDYITTETQALGTTGATQTIVPDYSREGFTVNTEKSILTDAIKGDGTTVLSVFYDRKQYTATFDGVEYNVFYGAALPTVEPAAVVGKEFAGWTPEVPEKMPAENLEFTSTWTDVMYKLIYIINGEEEVYEYAAGTAVTPIADPTVSGMTFLGWNTTIPEVMPAEDVIVVAKFEAAVFKVTFLDADGNVYDEKAVKCGDEIVVPVTNPTKDYSVFQGWEGIPADGLMPAYDLTIYPIFEAIPVRLVAAEGSTTIINRETGIITGLTTKMDYEIAEDYLAVEGDGYYTITAVGSYSRFGTGAIVEVWDNNAPEGSDPVETFYIVIYGDVNGDSAVNSLDGSIVKSEALYDTNWSRNDTVDALKVMAADLVKDGKIKNADADIIYNTALGVTSIDQATGTVVR